MGVVSMVQGHPVPSTPSVHDLPSIELEGCRLDWNPTLAIRLLIEKWTNHFKSGRGVH